MKQFIFAVIGLLLIQSSKCIRPSSNSQSMLIGAQKLENSNELTGQTSAKTGILLQQKDVNPFPTKNYTTHTEQEVEIESAEAVMNPPPVNFIQQKSSIKNNENEKEAPESTAFINSVNDVEIGTPVMPPSQNLNEINVHPQNNFLEDTESQKILNNN